MTEPLGRKVAPQEQHVPGPGQRIAAIPAVLSATAVGQLLAVLAAVSGAAPANVVAVIGIACSIIAIAALTELASDARTRRVVTALIAGHGVAAAVLLAGVAPGTPRAMLLIVLAAAAGFGLAGFAAVGPAVVAIHEPRPLTLAPRVAAIAVIAQALLQLWAASVAGLTTPLRPAMFFSIAALGIALLASLSIIALRVRSRWAIAGLLAWTVGWVASIADVSALFLWSLGGTFPKAPHHFLGLDAEGVHIVAAAGGLAIGAALVTAIREVRFRHSAFVLLAGYAVFGWIAAVGEHRIELAADFPSIVALRHDRDLADAIMALALAGMLWLYWRRVAAAPPGATWTARS